MADEVVYTGTADNSGNGDPLRLAMQKINAEFESIRANFNFRGTWATGTLYNAATRDYFLSGGLYYVTNVTHTSGVFATDLAAGRFLQIDLLALQNNLAGTGTGQGGEILGYKSDATGATPSTIAIKLRESKSLLDFITKDATGDALRTAIKTGVYTAPDRAAMYTACVLAWDSARAAPHDIYAPSGRYEIGDNNFPWRQTANPTTVLLDCKNVTIYCDGPSTIFSTYTPDGADVFQLNGLKNFHVKGFPTLTSTLTGFAVAGCNAVSLVGGYDNITLEITPTNLPSLDKGTNIDGGKGLSVQCSTTLLEVGTLLAKVNAKGCSIGFDFAGSLTGFLTKKVNIEVDLVAEDCHAAVVIGNAGATGAIPAGTRQNIRVRGSAINCQKDVVLGRAHGADVDMHVVTTKTAAARRLDPNSVAWIASDALVEAMVCTYAQNSNIIVRGDKGACDYKARIGGNTAGSSGLTGQTLNSEIELDIVGVAIVQDLAAVNSGGNIMADSALKVTKQTTASIAALDTLFGNAVYKNTLVVGTSSRMHTPIFSGRTSFAFGTDGKTESASVDAAGAVFAIQSKLGIASALSAGLYDKDGIFRLGIKNGDGLVIDAQTTAAALGVYIGKKAVYNSANVLLGYFPIYA
jgi:hypothetical protein